MISDKERMEAVKFLRDRICLKLDCRECHQMSKTLLDDEAVLCAVSDHWERLADLIDRPTCTMTYKPEWSGDEIYPTTAYQCSNCGCVVNEGITEYCPSCGCRVSNFETEPER